MRRKPNANKTNKINNITNNKIMKNNRQNIASNGLESNIEKENAFLKQELNRLHKELSTLKGELLKQKASNKERIIKQLQRENAKLRRENRKLFNMTKGKVRKVVRQTCAKVRIKNTTVKKAA